MASQWFIIVEDSESERHIQDHQHPSLAEPKGHCVTAWQCHCQWQWHGAAPALSDWSVPVLQSSITVNNQHFTVAASLSGGPARAHRPTANGMPGHSDGHCHSHSMVQVTFSLRLASEDTVVRVYEIQNSFPANFKFKPGRRCTIQFQPVGGFSGPRLWSGSSSRLKSLLKALRELNAFTFPLSMGHNSEYDWLWRLRSHHDAASCYRQNIIIIIIIIIIYLFSAFHVWSHQMDHKKNSDPSN